MEIDVVFPQRDLIAVSEGVLLDACFIHKRAVRAAEVLQKIAVRRLDEFGVMPRNMLVIQDDVCIALSSDQDLAGLQWQAVLLPVRSDPVKLRR